jgi:hypothetical protein
MAAKNIRIWIWLQNKRILKAVIDIDIGIIKIFDEFDKLILKRTGLKRKEVEEAEKCIIKYGAKKLGYHAKPFRFL